MGSLREIQTEGTKEKSAQALKDKAEAAVRAKEAAIEAKYHSHEHRLIHELLEKRDPEALSAVEIIDELNEAGTPLGGYPEPDDVDRMCEDMSGDKVEICYRAW